MFAFFCLLAPADPTVVIRPTDAGKVEVVATLTGKLLADVPMGVLTQAQGERWLRFCLVDPDSGINGPAIIGKYACDKSVLRFVPRYALSEGERYRAILDLGGGKAIKVEHRAAVAKPETPTVVEKIYPTSDVLPANQIKFYLHFSRPMRETKQIFDQILLLDDKGKPAHDPWRRTELWSADGKRLTLWIHPGRIKRGVAPREDEGPVLLPGKRYTLVLPAELLDAAGHPLGKDFTKTFRALEEDRTRPLPEKWKLQAPAAKTRQPLVVTFPEPLDRPLLDRFLTVADGDERRVTGKIEVGKEERTWIFHPDKAWSEAEYTLHVDGDLEDLAGNTPQRIFDTDLQEPAPKPPVLELKFRPK